MDYRCPHCIEDLRRRKLARAVVLSPEMDCPRCAHRIRLNVHPLEMWTTVASFGAFVVLAVLAHRLQSNALLLAALAAGLAGIVAVPLLDRTFFRSWPRYLKAERKAPVHEP